MRQCGFVFFFLREDLDDPRGPPEGVIEVFGATFAWLLARWSSRTCRRELQCNAVARMESVQ